MASKKIYSDPTMIAFEGLYVPEQGDLSPSYAPFVGTMPPTTERGFRTGGFAVPKDLTRADYRASWTKMVELLARMHKAGVPIVAGTDGAGIEIVHELEIYVQAGLTPAEALAAATIVPARLVGQDAKTGSIKVGKDRRSRARRGRSVHADWRPAADARGHAGRKAARRGCAAQRGRLLGAAEVARRCAFPFADQKSVKQLSTAVLFPRVVRAMISNLNSSPVAVTSTGTSTRVTPGGRSRLNNMPGPSTKS